MSAGLKSAIRSLKDAVLDGMAHARDKVHQVVDRIVAHLDDLTGQVHALDQAVDGRSLPSIPRRPYAPVRGADGLYEPGSLPSATELRDLTTTAPDTAFYWSGRDADGVGVGPDGSGAAEQIASNSGGRTLEQTLAANGLDPLPAWNPRDPESVRFWEDASAAFAENASGEVRAVVGADLRPGNVWQTVEIPRLLENPDVTSISQIDPDTGIWTRL